MANEDWELLVAIATKGRDRVGAVRQRIERIPVQEALPIDVTPLERKTAG